MSDPNEPPEPAAHPGAAGPGLSLRRSASWYLAGSTAYSAAQWGLVVILARSSGPEAVGQFALAIAVASPVFLAVGLNLPAVLATDALRRRPLAVYFRTRLVLILVAWVVSMLLGSALRLSGEEMLVLAAVSAAKAVEAKAQLVYGYFQLQGRLDLVARSLMARAGAGPALFAAAILSTSNVAVAVLSLAVAWALVGVFMDAPRLRAVVAQDRSTGDPYPGWVQVRALLRDAWPLGVDAGSRALSLSVPRVAIHLALSAAVLGVFSGLMSFAMLISLFVAALSAAFLPRLARLAAVSDHQGFRRMQSILSGLAVGVSLLTVAGSAVFGDEITEALLGPEFVDQKLLVALTICWGFAVLQGTLCVGLQAAQEFSLLAALNAATAVVVIVLTALCVPWAGAVGAAVALGASMAGSAAVAAGLLARSTKVSRTADLQ